MLASALGNILGNTSEYSVSQGHVNLSHLDAQILSSQFQLDLRSKAEVKVNVAMQSINLPCQWCSLLVFEKEKNSNNLTYLSLLCNGKNLLCVLLVHMHDYAGALEFSRWCFLFVCFALFCFVAKVIPVLKQ